MKLTNLLEGAFVVKSKDGVEKRFKKHDSPDALAWKETTAKKVKAVAYSQEWWEDKEYDDEDTIVPWTKIQTDEVSALVEKEVKEAFGSTEYDISSVGKAGETKVNGVDCATLIIRVMVMHDKDSDLGNDEDVEETHKFKVTRDYKKPTKFSIQQVG
jgi:hypothetical protein